MPQYDNTYVDDVDRYGFPPAAFDDAGQSIFNNQYHRRQLENLLGRVDDKNMCKLPTFSLNLPFFSCHISLCQCGTRSLTDEVLD